MILNFDNDTTSWLDGLLMGNGRLNSVVWHQRSKDIIGLNHEWLWTGTHGKRQPANSSALLPLVRDLLDQEDYYRATALSAVAFGGNGGISPIPRNEDMYKVAGELIFDPRDKVKEPHLFRSLDLENGIITTKNCGIELTAFVDSLDGCISLRWTNGGDLFSGTLAYERPEESLIHDTCEVVDNCFIYRGYIDEVSQFTTKVYIHTDGDFVLNKTTITLNRASYLECYVDIETTLYEEYRKHPTMHDGFFASTLEQHSKKFKQWMNRAILSISDEESINFKHLTINRRLERVRQGGSDPELYSIFAEFGKYLMVSGSLCGTLPLHLQGKWNVDPIPPWMSDYHFNINIQMNYWFVEELGYPEFAKQLFDYVDRFAKSGEHTAHMLYGTRGTILSLQGDQWAISTPEAYGYASWIGGGAWMAQHYWWHYRRSGDIGFLQHRAYPFFKKVLEFYEDYITYDNQGTVVISPSQSPENRFAGTGEYPVSMCKNSAMDVQLLSDALYYGITSSEILQIDNDQIDRWKDILRNLPGFPIAQDGRMLEWDSEDKRELDKGHRHTSHLYGSFPSDLFTQFQHKEQLVACEKSLDFRLSYEGADPGWSRAWAACLYARYGNNKKVEEHLCALLSKKCSSTLLDLHPKPPRATTRCDQSNYVFQIDGNLGGTRAIIESIVQCYQGHLLILPATPESWRNIYLRGIKLDGGHEVEIEVKNGVLIYCALRLGFEPVTVYWDNSTKSISGKKGSLIILVGKR